jgi:sugar lactone lactonase YvrE
MRHHTKRRSTRALIAGAFGAAALTASSLGASAGAVPGTANDLDFMPRTNNALHCSAAGDPVFADDKHGNPIALTKLMQAGDAATPVNAPATSNKVGAENDMIAVSPDGRFLFTPSEASVSDGITRLTLTGPDAGKKELLVLKPTTPTSPAWSRIDGMKWHTPSAMLLASEEFASGGIWQINPITGDFSRLDWLGNFSHEGIGFDSAGNLYLGDENRTGALYKAVPNDVRNLTKGGTLYYLVGTGIDPSGWKAVSNPANAVSEANNGGAILFDRPEDFDEANGLVYFAVTEPKSDADTRTGNVGQVVNQGGVYVLTTTGVPNLSTQSGANAPYKKLTPMITVNDPTYGSLADAQAEQGLQFPDNLAFDGHGNLWVHEDIPDGSTLGTGIDVGKAARDQQDELYVFVLNKTGDAIVPNPDASDQTIQRPGMSGGYKVADMQTSSGGAPCENEFTGGIFGLDGQTLYINQQHVTNPTFTARIG